MIKRLDALRTTALTKAYAKAVGALGIVLQDLVDNPGKPLFQADREVSNKILEARVARKTRTVDVSKEPLLMTRMSSLESSTKDGGGGGASPLKWSDIQILDLRNPKVAANYSAEFVKKYDALEPNNSAIRLLILETPLKTKALRAHIRMWVFFSVKEKQDKQTVKFLEKRAGVKKAAKNGASPAQAGISPVVAPLRVERGPGSFDAPDSIVVLATFLECPPVLKPASKRFDAILGVEKAKIIDIEIEQQIAEQMRAASEDAKKAEEKAKRQETNDDVSPPPELVDANATTVPVVVATSSSTASVPSKKDAIEVLVERYLVDGIKDPNVLAHLFAAAAVAKKPATTTTTSDSPAAPATLAVDADTPATTTPSRSFTAEAAEEAAKKYAAEQKEAKEAVIKKMVDDVRAELKEMASTYKAQTMALELVGIDYQRRRMEAREAIIVPRIDHGVIQFLFFTYAEHLMLRVLDARPNIAEPLAIVTVLENNGTIVNMDESTCITLSQLDTLIKAESSDSPTMTMYRGLHAAFSSAQFDPRRHVLMYFLERGKFQDLGQNVRKIIIAQANYTELEAAANYKIKSASAARQQPGAPTTVAEMLDSIRRANALKAQMAKGVLTQQPAPAT